MPMTLTDIGAKAILEKYFMSVSALGGDDFTIRLFVNDITPEDVDDVGVYVEANGGSYTPKQLLSTGFAVSIIDDIATAKYQPQIWIFSGPLDNNDTIYGYFITDDDNRLIFAERASFTYQPVENLDAYIVAPLFQLSKGTPT
jgi:hypothetical protein